MKEFAGKHILIIVENLPVPFDRRVWQEANTLKEQGADVSIICPQMKGYTEKRETINGIDIYRHPLLEGSGAIGYLIEYSQAIFSWFILSAKIFFKKKFHVIHGCNPPDLVFIVAVFYKLMGVKYVFDHHDVNPEFYIAKYDRKGFFYRALCFVEKLNFKVANWSISTNESYRDVAIKRGGMDPERVSIVRSGPKLEKLKILPPDEKFKKGKSFLIGYVGVIGESEGLDLLVDAAVELRKSRDDVRYAIVGSGIYLKQIQEYAKQCGVEDIFDFYGRVSDEDLLAILNSADVCVNPDRPSAMNNMSTMNKIMEYMALKKPIVQFDLDEGRFSAQEASLYATHNSIIEFADMISLLLNDESKRLKMGEYGYKRVKNDLSWEKESKNLIDFYTNVLNG